MLSQTEDSSRLLVGRANPLVRAFVRIRESVSPKTEAEAAIVAAQIQLTRSPSELVEMVLPLAAALIAYACRDWAPLPVLIGWVLTIAAICLTINLVSRQLEPLLERGIEGVRRVARTRTAMTACLLAAWSAMGVVFWIPGNPVNHMFIVLVLACSLACAAAILAAHPASVIAALIMNGSILVLRPALEGNALDFTLAGLGVVFCVLMASQVRTIYETTRHARELEFERYAIIRDLTRAKQESDRERERAAEAGRAKSAFLSNMSHELRTPMNAILGFSELIQNKSFGDAIDKYVQYGGIIHDSGQQLLALISDMLDLARIEGGKLTLQETTFSIAALIGDVAEAHRSKAEAGGLRFETVLEPGLPQIDADQKAIRGVITNLLSNAIKFTPPGGDVTISAKLEDDRRLAVAIEDTGIGIAPEDQLHVFERFGVRRHDVTTAEQGTGLGLAVVKGFAEAHDGEVVLKSKPGIGTRVTVFLPSSRVRAAVPPRRRGSRIA